MISNEFIIFSVYPIVIGGNTQIANNYVRGISWHGMTI